MAPFSERCSISGGSSATGQTLNQAISDNNRVVIKKFVAGKDPALG